MGQIGKLAQNKWPMQLSMYAYCNSYTMVARLANCQRTDVAHFHLLLQIRALLVLSEVEDKLTVTNEK